MPVISVPETPPMLPVNEVWSALKALKHSIPATFALEVIVKAGVVIVATPFASITAEVRSEMETAIRIAE